MAGKSSQARVMEPAELCEEIRNGAGRTEWNPHMSRSSDLTPYFSCEHVTTIAAKPHPKSACQLQRSLDGGRIRTVRAPPGNDP
jgi:hypothetical protein